MTKEQLALSIPGAVVFCALYFNGLGWLMSVLASVAYGVLLAITLRLYRALRSNHGAKAAKASVPNNDTG
jgi:hypothetical protein